MRLDGKLADLFEVELPILLAPMAGSGTVELAIAVAEAGGLGSLPCAMLTPEQIKAQTQIFQQRTSRPINLNFFCHTPPTPDPAREEAWKRKLEVYYREFGLDPDAPLASAQRAPFSEVHCALVEELKPAIVSFHFGLPEAKLLARVKAIRS